MKIKKFVFGPFSENTFVVYDEESKEAFILDPGNLDAGENEILHDYMERNNLSLKYIIVTHSHIDHLLGVKYLKNKYSAAFIAPQQDMMLFENAIDQGAMFGIKIEKIPQPDLFIESMKTIQIGDKKGEFIFTPGHTPGEHCLYFADEKVLFSGDVLFRESIGRTDLWGGNYNQLMDSILNNLILLPGDVKVYSGHGDETTIGHESKSNPFLNA